MSEWKQRYEELFGILEQVVDDRDRLGALLERALRMLAKEQCEKLAVGGALVKYRTSKRLREACDKFCKEYPTRKQKPRKRTK